MKKSPQTQKPAIWLKIIAIGLVLAAPIGIFLLLLPMIAELKGQPFVCCMPDNREVLEQQAIEAEPFWRMTTLVGGVILSALAIAILIGAFVKISRCKVNCANKNLVKILVTVFMIIQAILIGCRLKIFMQDAQFYWMGLGTNQEAVLALIFLAAGIVIAAICRLLLFPKKQKK